MTWPLAQALQSTTSRQPTERARSAMGARCLAGRAVATTIAPMAVQMPLTPAWNSMSAACDPWWPRARGL
jgi:hypothetical protein